MYILKPFSMPQAKQPYIQRRKYATIVSRVASSRHKVTSMLRMYQKHNTLVLIEACKQQPIAIRICVADIHSPQIPTKSKRENSHIFQL